MRVRTGHTGERDADRLAGVGRRRRLRGNVERECRFRGNADIEADAIFSGQPQYDRARRIGRLDLHGKQHVRLVADRRARLVDVAVRRWIEHAGAFHVLGGFYNESCDF